MLKKLLADGVKVALYTELSDVTYINDVVDSISNQALLESDGSRQLLSLDHTSDVLVQYDLQKAVLAVAGVLGATIPLAASPIGVASILAAISALGSLQGWTHPLPRTCALVVGCLLHRKKMKFDDLKSEFFSAYNLSNEIAELEFKIALERLRQIGSIVSKDDTVCLVERVLVRI